ncbi:MAG: hypothetical protein QM773_10255 [Hyphomonadaceae bacterium]
MRWVIGVAAFLAPVAIVMSAMAQTHGTGRMQGVMQTGAAVLIDEIARAIDAPRAAVTATIR